jgi:hypothetical protein
MPGERKLASSGCDFLVRQWLQFDDGSTVRAVFDQTAASRHCDPRAWRAAARGSSTSLPFEARRRRCRSLFAPKHGVWGLAGGAPASRSSAPTGPMRRARSLPALKLAKGDVARIIAAQGRRLGRGVAIAARRRKLWLGRPLMCPFFSLFRSDSGLSNPQKAFLFSDGWSKSAVARGTGP